MADKLEADELLDNDRDKISWEVGDWVKVEYDGILYPGEAVSIIGTNTEVSTLAKSGGYWKWPDENNRDLLWYTVDKVKGKINPVVPVGSRGQFKCDDL